MVALSQTREEAFYSMHTLQEIRDLPIKKPTLSISNQLLALLLIGVGSLLIGLGPYLSGTSYQLVGWCHHGQGLSAQGLFQELVWMARQHCAYCYLGAAMVGISVAIGLQRPS